MEGKSPPGWEVRLRLWAGPGPEGASRGEGFVSLRQRFSWGSWSFLCVPWEKGQKSAVCVCGFHIYL